MNAFVQRVKKAIRWRLKHWTLSTLIWWCRQHYFKWRMRLLSPKQREHIIQTLPQQIVPAGNKCAITVTFGARYFGNRDNMLENFLNSFLRMTEDILRIEIFIKVDLDDNLLFFYDLKRKYGTRINLRFFPSDRGRGYGDMHIWHSTLIKKRSPSSRALLILTEDSEFISKGWDRQLIACMDAMSHNYFIGTPVSLEETISLKGPNPPGIYWLRGDDYPIVSVPLLDITGRIAAKYPGWTSMGNLLLIDSYSADLLKSLWHRHKFNCHMQTPPLFNRRGIFSWTDSPHRAHLRNDSLAKFFRKENQDIRDEMGDAIAREVNKLSLATKGPS